MLSCILAGIAGRNVSITGISQTRNRKGLNLVRLVVGAPNAETAHDLQVVRKVLSLNGVRFCEAKVLQIRNISAGVPGAINAIYGALWCKVKVKALYFGESTRIFVYVSDLDNAAKILSQKQVPTCRKRCCDPKA